MGDKASSVGDLFSRVYLERGTPANDSVRFRSRIGFYISDEMTNAGSASKEIRKELGVEIKNNGRIWLWGEYFRTVSVSDMLSTITLIYRAVLASSYSNQEAPAFKSFVSRAFAEENLCYRVDEKCGVHFFIDEDFERSRISTVSGLHQSRYAAALEAFEASHKSLIGQPADTLTATRRAFDAVENVFKIMFGVSRLGASEVKSKLIPLIMSTTTGRTTDAAKRLVDAFAEWINASHQYRHAPGEPDPSPPPLGLALVLISSAATYLRWLIELDANAA